MRYKLAELSELKEGIPKRVVLENELEVVVVKIGERVYALKDSCSHEHFLLSVGEVDVDEKTIECAKHGSVFDLETGKALTLPATSPVETYEIEIINDEVFIKL